MADYRMFAACRCGERILETGDRYSIYYIVRQWQKHHEALGHKLISSDDAPEEYYRLYSTAITTNT